MQAIVRPYFRHTIDEIETQAIVSLDVSREAILTELRFRDGRRARKLYAKLMGETASRPVEKIDMPVAAPEKPVSEQKPVAKVRHPAKAKRAPTGTVAPHKPGPVMRAVLAEKARYGANSWEKQYLKREATDPEFKARQDKLRAQCQADNEEFWRRNPPNPGVIAQWLKKNQHMRFLMIEQPSAVKLEQAT
jgi:hypothetical protein